MGPGVQASHGKPMRSFGLSFEPCNRHVALGSLSILVCTCRYATCMFLNYCFCCCTCKKVAHVKTDQITTVPLVQITQIIFMDFHHLC